MSVRVASVAVALLVLLAAPPARARREWPGFARDAQHTALSPVRSQPLARIRWSTPVDLAPDYWAGELLIHYATPLVSSRGTVFVVVKTGLDGGFRVEAHDGADGHVVWTQPLDYALPEHGWVPSVPAALVQRRLVVAGDGGTLVRWRQPDLGPVAPERLAFYGVEHWLADPAAFADAVWITTPVTTDGHGTMWFGFTAAPGAPLGLRSGVARIARTGIGTWIAAADAAADPTMEKVPYNAAPALSRDRRTLYVPVGDAAGSGFGHGWLVALDATTLAPRARVRLRDVLSPAADAYLPDDGTASPTVGPDGDVYQGVLGNPPTANHLRGWLLHFDAGLTTAKTPGAFGWDDTVSVVPRAMVPTYAGPSRYLLLAKYNDYVEGGGTGVNRLAVLDPTVPATDPISGATVMDAVETIASPTPDPDRRDVAYPLAVREWCVNTAAVDQRTRSVLANDEGGTLYRWDLATGALVESLPLAGPLGQAYTPTVIGGDGTVYAVNDGILFAVSAP
jgi:hypothetical protein